MDKIKMNEVEKNCSRSDFHKHGNSARTAKKMKIQKDIGTLLDEVVLVVIGEAGNRGIVGKVVGRLVGGGSV